MYRRILTNEKWTWYRADVLFPLAVASVTALACRWVMPEQTERISELIIILISSSIVLIVTSMSAPLVRVQLIDYLIRQLGPTKMKKI